MPRSGDVRRWDEHILNEPTAAPSPNGILTDDHVRMIINELKNHFQTSLGFNSNSYTRLLSDFQYIGNYVRSSSDQTNVKFEDLQSQIALLTDEVKTLKASLSQEVESIESFRQEVRHNYLSLAESIQQQQQKMIQLSSTLVSAAGSGGLAPTSRTVSDLERELDLVTAAMRRVYDQLDHLRDDVALPQLQPPNSSTSQRSLHSSPQLRGPPSLPPAQGPAIHNLAPLSQIQRPSIAQQQPTQQSQQLQQQQSQHLQQQQQAQAQQSQGGAQRQRTTSANPSSDRRSDTSNLMYAMAVNLRTVKDMWTEYAHGLNDGPAIRQLENQHGTTWRGGARSAQSRKFQRQRALYDAIEKGIDTGKSAEECCQDLERLRTRPDGKWQSLTWLLHNIPPNMFDN
ncbi:transcriptional activator of glycolytic enzymes-domain-containing protein [Lipomyces oligophaga]|uniref:transcriptional activator of glycolytic enzymes-domain-containing protein n=1 Tax=Lipomyces oligophaga TaxID=45792 RepID=UPI0034CE6BDF